MIPDRTRGGKLRYVDSTDPEDFIPDFGTVNPNEISLTELADAHGSDKGTLKHNYCKKYETIIQKLANPYRCNKNELKLSVLEIGVACGASLRTWACYLPSSSITGIDVREECESLCKDLDNTQILTADARQKSSLDSKLGSKNFDLIIDDGSHISEDINTTFQALWGRVKPGGYYCIEDLACTYNPNYSAHINKTFGENTINNRSTTLQLVDFLLKSCDQHQNNISSLRYYPQLLIIQKS